jgi:integrase
MKLTELIDTLNNQRYNDSPSYKVMQSKQKELLKIVSGNTDIKKIDSNMINRLIKAWQAKGNTSSTINSKLAFMSMLLTYAWRNNLIEHKPYIPTFKVTSTKEKYLSDDEIELMMDYCNTTNQKQLSNIILTGLNTGMRINEILNLTPDNIQDNYFRIWKNKGNKPNSVPMNPKMIHLFTGILEENDINLHELIFRLNYSQVEYQFNKMVTALNLTDVTLHTLRHTFCSKLVQKNIPLTTIQQLANHRSYKTTLRYAHLANKQLEDAVNCL